MIVPLQRDEVLLADIQATMARQTGVSLWWLGQSGYLIHFAGVCIAVDPYLSDSLTHKYAATDKPHERISARVIDPALLSMVSLVTSSHNHTDHLDAETLHALWSANPTMRLVVPEANRVQVANRLDVSPDLLVGVDDGIREHVGGFAVTGVPAAHEELERDELGRFRYLGYVVEAGPWTLYHSGDTIDYPELSGILRRFAIDVALLPINGRSPERRVAGNLDGPQAAQLAKEVGARLVIPCHYDMFAFNTTTPDAFVAACERLAQPYRVLRNGERWSSTHDDLADAVSGGRLSAGES